MDERKIKGKVKPQKKVLGRGHPDTLGSMNNIAEALRSQGKYAEAEAIHRETLSDYEKVLGRDHPSTLASMNNLAAVLDKQGKCIEAEQVRQIERKQNRTPTSFKCPMLHSN